MKLFYLANIRLPTEKAHGLQIAQMCEAFAQTENWEVTLFVARRVNTPEMNRVKDVFAFYGVAPVFSIRRVTCLDLYRLLRGRAERLAFMVESLSYLAILCMILLFRRADLYYSRDPVTLLALSFFKPRRKLCYEAHQLSQSALGKYLQSLCVRRAGHVIAITGPLAERLRERGAKQVIVAHDGIREARFQNVPDQAQAREQLGLSSEAFIVGYVGRFNAMGVSKGVSTLVEAVSRLASERIVLLLAGGPDKEAQGLRDQWIRLGLEPERFIYVGVVPAARVPIYLSACDVCAMPLPWTDYFAHYVSALKLFEYMASGRAIVASDLPAVVEVVRDGHSALLVQAGDPDALAEGLRRLKVDPGLRARLGAQAQADVQAYFWSKRAERILASIYAPPSS